MSPGLDGFTDEFSKFFGFDVGHIYFMVIKLWL